MLNRRFSAQAFSEAGLDSTAARKLADELAMAVTEALDQVVRSGVAKMVDELNALGHELRLEVESVGEVSYRDETPARGCRLRLAVDTVVSTGYAHVIVPSEMG